MADVELKAALVALYGKWGWQTKAAEALGVDASSIRRWTNNQVPVPGPVAAAVRCFMREKARLTKSEAKKLLKDSSLNLPEVEG